MLIYSNDNYIKQLIFFPGILFMQKLSALSSSLARVVSTDEEEEAKLDQFPTEGVRKIICFDYVENKYLSLKISRQPLMN